MARITRILNVFSISFLSSGSPVGWVERNRKAEYGGPDTPEIRPCLISTQQSSETQLSPLRCRFSKIDSYGTPQNHTESF